jgi:HemY protein
MAIAEAALDAQLWGKARTHLLDAEKDGADMHLYQLLARLEKAEHNDLEAAHRWLAKATEQEAEAYDFKR